MKRLPRVSERFDTNNYCKGEDSSKATDEEKRICQKVTGYAYDRLWRKENALRFMNR